MRHLVQRRQSESGHRSRIAIGPTWNKASSFGKNRVPLATGGCSGSSATPAVLFHMRRVDHHTIRSATQWRPHPLCGQDCGLSIPRMDTHGEWIRAAFVARPITSLRRAQGAWRPDAYAVIVGLISWKSARPPARTKNSVLGAFLLLTGHLSAVDAKPPYGAPMCATTEHDNALDARQRTGYAGRATYPATMADQCNAPVA